MRYLLLLTLCFGLFTAFATAQQVEVKNIPVNGMTFKCRVAGDPANPLVILLHGWPETSHMWIPLMEKLAAEGYYCVAPDQRGFSPGARPKKIKDYDIHYLVDDVIALADSLGARQFHLIGHDWGSAIGWALVTFHPKRIKSWSALSVPHIHSFSDAIRFNKEQAEKSRYMKLFQLKGIPEWFLLRKDREALRQAWKQCSPEQLEDYLNVLGNKPALKASLAYYRANYKTLKKGKGVEAFGDVNVPTLYIWGNTDIAVTRVAAEGTMPYMKGPYKFIELDAGHWLMQEAFDQIYEPILDHLNKYK